jgi:hypothetical protein
MDEQTADFYKLEYTILRAYIGHQYDKQYWWLVYVTSANGAIYIWISEKFSTLSNPLLAYLALSASALITFSGYRLFKINAAAAQSAIDYCTGIERKFLQQDGWGDFFARASQKRLISTKGFMSILLLMQMLVSLAVLINLLLP